MLKYGLSMAEIREEQRMEYARLGNTGLMVSELCLGCMTFGREADEGDSREIVGRFVEAGGNFIDTADVYSKGVSEEITGRAIREVRDDVVLATKVRFPMGDGPNEVGLTQAHYARVRGQPQTSRHELHRSLSSSLLGCRHTPRGDTLRSYVPRS